ncbi:MAG: DUF1464 family protein [Candidatus Altiarchaeota archaeon]|nr:DUF1464 family protein [Candidatus Altiarchaeota archaeon]
MVRVMGIDPGTKSFDFCGIDEGRVVLNESILSGDIAGDPGRFVEVVESMDAEFIVGPSGYGLPVKRLSELDARDLFLLTLVKPEELDRINVLSGMQKSFKLLREKDVPMYFIPGVIHLPTVPGYRKLNRIDMGTADKLCCAVLGIRDQAARLGLGFNQTSFILLEIGFGYTSAVAVSGGRIMDGVGGTGGSPGYSSPGSMDGELAYLLGTFPKTLLFEGGASSIAGRRMTPERLSEVKGTEDRYSDAWECLIEGAAKDVLMLLASLKNPKEILVSGRLSRIHGVVGDVSEKLDGIAPVRRVGGFSKDVKDAAQGAALVADGLAGGEYQPLIENMKLRKAKGTVLDYIKLEGANEIRRRYGI